MEASDGTGLRPGPRTAAGASAVCMHACGRRISPWACVQQWGLVLGVRARACRCTARAASVKHALLSEGRLGTVALRLVGLQLQRLGCCRWGSWARVGVEQGKEWRAAQVAGRCPWGENPVKSARGV